MKRKIDRLLFWHLWKFPNDRQWVSRLSRVRKRKTSTFRRNDPYEESPTRAVLSGEDNSREDNLRDVRIKWQLHSSRWPRRNKNNGSVSVDYFNWPIHYHARANPSSEILFPPFLFFSPFFSLLFLPTRLARIIIRLTSPSRIWRLA